mgnify:CR=1 FL=1
MLVACAFSAEGHGPRLPSKGPGRVVGSVRDWCACRRLRLMRARAGDDNPGILDPGSLRLLGDRTTAPQLVPCCTSLPSSGAHVFSAQAADARRWRARMVQPECRLAVPLARSGGPFRVHSSEGVGVWRLVGIGSAVYSGASATCFLPRVCVYEHNPSQCFISDVSDSPHHVACVMQTPWIYYLADFVRTAACRDTK